MPRSHRRLIAALAGISTLIAREITLAGERPRLDLARFGRLVGWTDEKASQMFEIASLSDLPEGARGVGVVWEEDRDICEIRVRCGGSPEGSIAEIQYWNNTWPPPPPKMPSTEDPVDDPWQGQWLTAQTERTSADGAAVYTFRPLKDDPNDKARHLPDVSYRRTLKVRLVWPDKAPRIESLHVFSQSALEPMSVRIELGCGDTTPVALSGQIGIYNGQILSVKPWRFEPGDSFEPPLAWKNVMTGPPKGVIADILASDPAPAGSNDITVVTVHGTAATPDGAVPRTFSFSTLDLKRGPMYVPACHTSVARAEDPPDLAASQPDGAERTIRQRIPLEPEQTLDRASREIPPLDPWVRQHGDRVYLPVAVDASWQKFVVEYGGEIFISKRGTKAKGAELKRLQWPGDTLRFRIGTGEQPYFREDHKARAALAEDCLPIVINRWEHDGLAYEEEAFATLLAGPLDPEDPARSEQTPAICMVRLNVHNPAAQTRQACVWFTTAPEEQFSLDDGGALAFFGSKAAYQPPRLRAVIQATGAARMRLASPQDLQAGQSAILTQLDVAAGASKSVFISIPFVSDLTSKKIDDIKALDYDRQRDRVAAYWRDLIDRTTRFTTPERTFNLLARSVVPHIHISATKDPRSGLYMVPAASYNYQVYANETCFQTLLLDALGDTERSALYLKTLTRLQGTRSFPGNYATPHDGVFHGAKVDDEYDYTASDYGLDHGTVLWTLARHYLFTRDADWLKANLPHMLKAIDWIERQRATTRNTDRSGNKVLEYGLLPAGHLEDNADWGYWYAVNAYCAAGMIETAAAMRHIGHPDADRMHQQAAAFRDDLRESVRRSTERAPVVRMRDGTCRPYVPTRCAQRFRGFGPLRVQYYSRYGLPDVLPCYRLSATREVLYGPMILLNLGIFDPGEPIADWILDDWEDNLTLSSSGGFNVHGFTDDRLWFSQGGMVFQSNLQNPILVYLSREETPAAIRGLYNSLAACLYPEIYTLTEEYRMWRHASGPFYKSPDEARFVNRLRDALLLESGEELRLAAGAPRRWLASRSGIQVDRLNSCFGPVGFSLRAGEQTNTVLATVTPPTRVRPKRLWLYARLPEAAKIRSVEINGQPWDRFDADRERILLPAGDSPLDVVIRY